MVDLCRLEVAVHRHDDHPADGDARRHLDRLHPVLKHHRDAVTGHPGLAGGGGFQSACVVQHLRVGAGGDPDRTATRSANRSPPTTNICPSVSRATLSAPKLEPAMIKHNHAVGGLGSEPDLTFTVIPHGDHQLPPGRTAR